MNHLSKIWFDIIENLFKKQVRQYRIKVGNEWINFHPNDIIRIQADGSYSNIITRSGNYLISRNLHYVEQIIHGWGFLRVNRSNIINITHLKELDRERSWIKMSDGTFITIPRRSKNTLFPKLEQCLKSA